MKVSQTHAEPLPAASTDPLFSGRLGQWLRLIRDEFAATPDLSLTAEDASRRWQLPLTKAEAILNAFVDVRFLRRLPEGAYCRAGFK